LAHGGLNRKGGQNFSHGGTKKHSDTTPKKSAGTEVFAHRLFLPPCFFVVDQLLMTMVVNGMPPPMPLATAIRCKLINIRIVRSIRSDVSLSFTPNRIVIQFLDAFT
jgi:hypothetical protein